MPLKVDDMVQKAKEKGYTSQKNKNQKQVTYTKPWQNESTLSTSTINSSDHTIPAELLIEIDPNLVENWKYHDRPEGEMGDIAEFAKELTKIGQQQPCIVRKHPSKNNKYELIIGERRWRAAKYSGVNLKVIVSDMNDNIAALAQAAENDQRKNISDYAKGMSFHKLIEEKVIIQKDLIERLGKSKQYVSALLSFGKLPEEIVNAIGDMSKVSARTAEKIKQLSSKGQLYIEAIISHAEKIRDGKVGNQKLEKLVSEFTNAKSSNKEQNKAVSNKKIYSPSGRHLFTWRLDNNRTPSIHFPKDILKLFESGQLNKEELTLEISQIMDTKLMAN